MGVPPFMNHLGVRIEKMAGGEATATIELEPHHLNNRGVAHGGVVSSLLDSVLGAAVISAIPKEWWCATISLSVQYLEGARGGPIHGTGRLLRRGSRTATAEGEVRDASGRVVAVAQGAWHLWPHRPGRGSSAPEPFVVVKESGEPIEVGKILAVGRNYAEHAAEMGGSPSDPPVLFFKPATSLVHDGGAVRAPLGLGELHHEVEMVVVIGKEGRAVPRSEALDHVLGFAVGLDMTLRDLQSEAKKKGEPWTLAKGFDTSAPVSLVVPRESVGDGLGLTIALDVNGERRQEGNTSQMRRDVPELIAYASELITLEPGDLLFTGTPPGVGAVRPGDVLTASLEKVGTLTVRIEEETRR